MQPDLNDQRSDQRIDKAAPAGYTTLTDPTFLASLPATARATQPGTDLLELRRTGGLAVDPATDA